MNIRLGDSEEYVSISASREAYQGGAIGPDIFAAVEVRVGGFSAARHGSIGLAALTATEVTEESFLADPAEMAAWRYFDLFTDAFIRVIRAIRG